MFCQRTCLSLVSDGDNAIACTLCTRQGWFLSFPGFLDAHIIVMGQNCHRLKVKHNVDVLTLAGERLTIHAYDGQRINDLAIETASTLAIRCVQLDFDKVSMDLYEVKTPKSLSY